MEFDLHESFEVGTQNFIRFLLNFMERCPTFGGSHTQLKLFDKHIMNLVKELIDLASSLLYQHMALFSRIMENARHINISDAS